MSRLAVPLLFLAAACGLTSAQPWKEPTHGGKALSEWVKQLGSDDADARRMAEDAARTFAGQPDALAEALLATASDPENKSLMQARALAAMGPRAVPTLTAGLWDAKTRKVSLLVIARLGAEARTAAPSLVRLLSDPDEETRATAAGCLWEVNAYAAVPHLTKLLEDRSPKVRLMAADSLVRFGADPTVVLPVLRALVKNGPADSQEHALLLLGMLGPAAKDAVPALVAMLPDANPLAAVRVAQALGRIGSAAKDSIPALRKPLADEKKDARLLRAAVAVALWQIARDPEAAKLLREQLGENEAPPASREKAIRLLWRIDRSKESIEALAAQLKSENPTVAIAAAGTLGDAHKDAVPLLGKMLAHKDAAVRAQAVVALHQLGAGAAGALEPVRAATKDDDPLIAFWATSAVCRIEPKAEGVAALAGHLADRDPLTRQDAAHALAQLGPAGKPAVARLTAATADAEPAVRVAVAVALWKVEASPVALQTLVELLRHADPAVRTQAALELGAAVGADAKPAVPELVKRLFDPYSAVRSETAEALGRIGANAKDAAPALVTVLEGDEPGFVHSAACEALGLIEAADKDAIVAVLKKKLDHPDPVVRAHAALALVRVAGDKSGEKEAERGLACRSHHGRITAMEALWLLKKDDRVVPLLIRVLEESNLDGTGSENERYMAARALGRIGPAAKPAVAELTKLLRHPDATLASTAADSLEAITSEKK